MAYLNGSAASFADLKTAIENAAIAAGWALADGILSKNGCFFQLIADTSGGYAQLRLHGGTGKSGSTLTGQPASNLGVKIASSADNPISFPITYEIHYFDNPDEIYCVTNYNSDYYQTLAFGKSDVPGIGGTGAWFTGNMTSNLSLTGTGTTSAAQRVHMSVGQSTCGSTPYSGMCCPFWFAQSNAGSNFTSYVHTGLDSVAWRVEGSVTAGSGLGGISYAAALLTALPNLSNQATVLVPVKAIAYRLDGGRTIVANPKNVRYMRLDNVVPGEIVSFGADQWKCYPMLRKDSTVRNGQNWTNGQAHTGTWGYAIKYTGS
ncbi:putative structural protein [Pseudomonas phage Kaya]|uniref:Structural protein n=1 Tax=Pseudomonas phage Kaya TaxID=2872675 RepID=A0AAE8XBT5_9CAUD|nr:structural protein [Pseudomonas phage Kaya]UAG58573.1 putative structural protein [Pseudomonas phage Kaya]